MGPLLVLACHSTGVVPDGPSADGTTVPPEPQPPVVAIDVAPAFDPLRGPLDVAVETEPEAVVTLEISLDGEVVATAEGVGLASTPFDGRQGEAFRDAAVYDVRASAVRDGLEAEATATVAAVRVGFATAWLEDDDGVTATREPLFFPVGAELQDEADPVTAIETIDDGAAPLELPAVGEDTLAVRPEGAEPAAFVFDARPILVLAQGPSVAMEEAGLDLVAVDVSAAGWTVLSGSPLEDGAPVVLQRDAPLGDTVGVTDEEVAVTFSSGGVAFGEQQVPLRIYRLLDVSQFEDPAAGYRPWAPVVAEALPALEGVEAAHDAVADALVEWIYRDLGLTYDTQYGMSAYSEYLSFDWDRPHFRLSDFLVRRFGSVVNCSDAANILGAYANMVGARIDHLVIDPDFDLNNILAIGGTDFTSCPFGPWSGCGFSYHAVTTEPDSLEIWDATLALDGDADPGALPSVELLVQTIPAAEYLDRLVRAGRPTYHDQSQETLE